MFEKVKSKIFGKKTQQVSVAASNQQQAVQPVASVNTVQRQPTWDVSIKID